MLHSKNEFLTICENINQLNSRQESIEKEKKIFSELLAQHLISEDINPSELKAILYPSIKDILKNDNDIIDFFSESVSILNAPFSKTMCLSLSCDEFSPTDSAKIVYVKNNFSDSAFVRFSKIFKSPKVSYRSSFEEICEDIYNGVGDYCILPIENANGGKLFSFYSLIDKYELRIFAICDLNDGNSDHSTRYALLSKRSITLEHKNSVAYFEFSIISNNWYETSNILDAAKRCGLKLFRIDTTSVPYDDSKFEFYHVFECTDKIALPFILYLDFKYPQHKNFGYYISL